ncbi:uncharacterized protein LACBIDRAFT_314891 [Laccaria bicolor S238N-H82]|uniref:Predicted protein n=1 Tax=Laccaria bicolor (strain S238N-H82 / ATCC MYA-4686) TaxID=486041 RepID=B0DZF0_LACBS|nr:uncharacterized protein LACBIDRAFT_314891 [Laccaria bicolor S238N-H82]EDR00033.1 predicted protein [Laccaria bicolor S238N-H82]|eukprot:XP_001889342.1 predicted protein [Laccaria bicolor S238N-H82]
MKGRALTCGIAIPRLARWSIKGRCGVHASHYHPHLVVGTADGSCSTMNTPKSTP